MLLSKKYFIATVIINLFLVWYLLTYLLLFFDIISDISQPEKLFMYLPLIILAFDLFSIIFALIWLRPFDKYTMIGFLISFVATIIILAPVIFIPLVPSR